MNIYRRIFNSSLEYTEVEFLLVPAELEHGVVYPVSIEGHVGVDAGVAGLSAPDAPADQPGQLVVVLGDLLLYSLLFVVVIFVIIALTKDMIHIFANVVNECFASSEFLNKKILTDSV